MFKKKKKLVWMLQQVTRDANGVFHVIPAGAVDKRLTIDEFERMTKDAITEMFDEMRKTAEGHDISVGTAILPLFEVVHDDENKNDTKWQETKQKLLSKIQ